MGFEGDGRRTTTRLIDGQFPEYQRLLPTEWNSRASVDTHALIDAVKRVSLVTEKQNPVRLSFAAGELRLSAGAGDEAQADEFLDCGLDGEPIEIAFNPMFLLDGLGAIDAPVARFSFTLASKPAILGGAGDHDSDVAPEYQYLLMPVRLSGS
jgi:DNA polymerase-3 subunit beta